MACTSAAYAKKKTTRYQERSEEARAIFQAKLQELDPDKVVFIDEAGMDNRLYRAYARAPRGQKVLADVCGKKRERVSILGALKKKRFIAPFTFIGGCN